MRKTIRYVIILIAFFLTGCAGQAAESNGKPLVYTSFYPVYDIVSSVAGDTLDLRTFMPANQDPHMWEPTPRDMRQLSEAELLIVNGANMEKWVAKVSESLPDLEILTLADGVDLITYRGAAAIGDFQYMAGFDFDVAQYALEFGHTHEDNMRVAFYYDQKGLSESALIAKGKEIMAQKAVPVQQKSTITIESGVVYDIEMGHEAGIVHYNVPEAGRWIFYADRLSENILSYELIDADAEALPRYVYLERSTSALDKVTYDPHSWLSLVNAKKYIRTIETTLAAMYPDEAATYARNRLQTIEAITSLEYEYKDKFKDIEMREFVVTHYAYAYLARDFALRQFPLQSLASMEAPSLKTIKKALEFCDFYEIDTIFYETGQEQKAAATLAYDLGGEALPLTSMEYMPSRNMSPESQYVTFMRDNLEKIYESLR